ncbi:MAG: cyanophycin synthetase [Oscillospiraceae bacterium]
MPRRAPQRGEVRPCRFNGAGRRFEFKGKYNGADIYDDYAHHPGELKALLNTVENLNYKRTVVVFQPHTYSRTAALFDDFVKQLRRPDVLLLAEIFAAREKNTIGISSAALADRIDGAVFCPTFDELEDTLRAIAAPGISCSLSARGTCIRSVRIS